jgi:hypothetical protein
VLSYPQAAARRQVAAPWPAAARPPRLAVAAGRSWQYLNTYRMSISPDPLPPYRITHYGYKKKFGSSR